MIAVYLANGFEEIEALAVVDVLRRAELEGRVINVSADLPKSFIVMEGKKPIIYISQISAATLKKRSGYIDDIKNI